MRKTKVKKLRKQFEDENNFNILNRTDQVYKTLWRRFKKDKTRKY